MEKSKSDYITLDGLIALISLQKKGLFRKRRKNIVYHSNEINWNPLVQFAEQKQINSLNTGY